MSIRFVNGCRYCVDERLSYHLMPSCSSGSAGWRLGRPTDLLSGDCGCIGHPHTVVTLTRRQQLPGDAGNLVGERHRRELRRLACQQPLQPGCRMAAGAVAPVAPGYMADATHCFTGAFITAGIVLIVGIPAYVFLLGRLDSIPE